MIKQRALLYALEIFVFITKITIFAKQVKSLEYFMLQSMKKYTRAFKQEVYLKRNIFSVFNDLNV